MKTIFLDQGPAGVVALGAFMLMLKAQRELVLMWLKDRDEVRDLRHWCDL